MTRPSFSLTATRKVKPEGCATRLGTRGKFLALGTVQQAQSSGFIEPVLRPRKLKNQLGNSGFDAAGTPRRRRKLDRTWPKWIPHRISPPEFRSLMACAASQSQWFLCTTMRATQWAFSLISPYPSLFWWISVGPASTSSSFFLGSSLSAEYCSTRVSQLTFFECSTGVEYAGSFLSILPTSQYFSSDRISCNHQ